MCRALLIQNEKADIIYLIPLTIHGSSGTRRYTYFWLLHYNNVPVLGIDIFGHSDLHKKLEIIFYPFNVRITFYLSCTWYRFNIVPVSPVLIVYCFDLLTA